MPIFWLVVVLLAFTALGFWLGRRRALISAQGNPRDLHSLPIYYGANVAMSVAIPALLTLVVWLLAQPVVIENRIAATLPQELIPESTSGAWLKVLMSLLLRAL